MSDRLTNETNIINAVRDEGFALMLYLKLKKYEDLGYSPEELQRIITQNELRGKLIKSARIEVKIDVQT